MSDLFTRMVRAAALAEAQAVETACEKALLSGDSGVLILRDVEGRFIAAEPSKAVPYGHIYEWRKDWQF